MSALFPMTPTTLHHTGGGRITKVHGIEHQVAAPAQRSTQSRDIWFFRADVKWADGSGESLRTEVAPFQLCCDGEPASNAELETLLRALDAYLAEHGTWSHPKFKGWYAHRAESVS